MSGGKLCTKLARNTLEGIFGHKQLGWMKWNINEKKKLKPMDWATRCKLCANVRNTNVTAMKWYHIKK